MASSSIRPNRGLFHPPELQRHPSEPWRHHPHIQAMASSTCSSDLFCLSYVSSDRGVIIHLSKPGSLPFVQAMAPSIHPTLGFLHHEPWRQPSALALASSIRPSLGSICPSLGVIIHPSEPWRHPHVQAMTSSVRAVASSSIRSSRGVTNVGGRASPTRPKGWRHPYDRAKALSICHSDGELWRIPFIRRIIHPSEPRRHPFVRDVASST